ncbi:beta-lactam antibiotic acylase [Alkalihalobacillus alcalophilus ATCC 27647 = CGMCC 1.3604]|uniref:Beta-lactam antibiotic acylase n=1 Tax=Alkalihalobacillus alcalophilus ATCC 27647 = CGMCC 1.3604 TaxID=1218173 RepID=A0A094YWG6_ALKAL|nr:penicillin acylase family protein [Alkalihalobacillus alcalophilus]KGA97862.1 beta-lactam antibiotic acylase [Alkalihalobacillus alcalophilus ATCC 27647 = CGMCC 1.3604]MED1562107.1 penicillin acylase family protein [Alkalihalobacillus alcalophilus]THG88674.1 beta-lactam antibiotic acylase [Alkalihalobacillus alcalophilus ATCC 27647 = CGMCC 1.3604]
METVIVKKKATKRWKKGLLWTGAGLVFLVIAVLVAGNLFLNRSLPQITGEISLQHLSEPVTVIRDEKGVPHINAANEQDLYIAQGYIQAQDRLFQMDLSRRQASGTLSEVIGEASIENDKYFRTLGLRRAAEDSVQAYSSEGINVLGAFSLGVNLYIEELRQNGKWPVEFTILGYEPEGWTIVDSLTIGKYMAYDLGGHWENQAFRQYLIQSFDEEKAYDLFPEYPEDAPYIIGVEELDFTKAFANAVIPHEHNGSNNWVLSGEKTESGMPLLADDPHLGLATPSIWYQMHLEAPTVNVSGVIFAGVPGIILGHNENVAWGVTNTGPDVQDLYIEKRNPENPNQYLYNGEWEEAQVIPEPIKVKGQETLDYEVTITRHGPVISEFADVTESETVLSMQWTALEPSTELEAILNMNKAKNWEEFEEGLLDFHTPVQNFVVADTEGNIAFKANGKIPIRKQGNGLLPVPGWTDEYGWDGYVPFDELPRLVNPEEGFIATANNKVISDEYPYHISHHWAQPYRQLRIVEVLSDEEGFTAEDMIDLQMDIKNLHAAEFIPPFMEVLSQVEGTREKEALNILSEWDYFDEIDQAAPYIFNIWMRKIADVLFNEQVPEEMRDLFNGERAAVDQLLRRALAGNPGPWVEEAGGFEDVLTEALIMTLDQIEAAEGSNMSQWKWGNFHQVHFTHPLSSVSPLNYLFNSKGGQPVAGSQVTVQAAAFRDNGVVNHGASWRYVIDMEHSTEAYHIVGPGQSEHVKSKWYDDQFEDWINGNYHKTVMAEPSGETLLLKPVDVE